MKSSPELYQTAPNIQPTSIQRSSEGNDNASKASHS